jgi:hypothetical protein
MPARIGGRPMAVLHHHGSMRLLQVCVHGFRPIEPPVPRYPRGEMAAGFAVAVRIQASDLTCRIAAAPDKTRGIWRIPPIHTLAPPESGGSILHLNFYHCLGILRNSEGRRLAGARSRDEEPAEVETLNQGAADRLERFIFP